MRGGAGRKRGKKEGRKKKKKKKEKGRKKKGKKKGGRESPATVSKLYKQNVKNEVEEPNKNETESQF
ncbi:hypothetical protein HG556_08875 [Pasteurella multocida]|nr:hypothetical protein [Pasteurella multocida]